MITVPPGFTVSQIATVPSARELAFTRSGDLYVGTSGSTVYIVRRAEDEHPGSARIYVRIDDSPDAGVTYGNDALYVGTQHGIWRVENGKPMKIASVRTGGPPPGSDGDVHTSTSVAFDAGTLYASVGSSCNACIETDRTRATIGKVSNGRYDPIAVHVRNAIALAIDPSTHALWAGNAGQDDLPAGHPYEFFDNVTAHRQPADYGWPFCYENRRRKGGSSQRCAGAVIAQVVFPAYETPIGAVFYPSDVHGRYAFPTRYRGGAFVTLHGSWHGPAQGLAGYEPPRVVFLPMRSGRPQQRVDWSNPSGQWSEFVGGYQNGGTSERSGRPTGIALGPQGDLFVADDQTGAIYRIRPKR